MARRTRTVILCTAAAALLSLPAMAQSTGERVIVSVGGGVQAATGRLADHFEIERNVEPAVLDVKYPLKPGLLIDGGVGIRIWRHVGVGVAVSQVTGSYAADIDASIPHPLLFGQPRAVHGEASGITHNETGVHVQLQYSITAGPRATLVLAAGPSRLRVEQELVTDVKYSETYPYDEAAFTSAVTQRSKASANGFNVGADLRWRLGGRIGFGGGVRYTRADVTLQSQGNRHITVHAGGVHVSAGIRIGF